MKISKPVTIVGILLGFVVGFGAGYVRNAVGFVNASGLLYGGNRKGDGFTQTLDKLAHLGTIEYAAANCSHTGDAKVALTNESKMLAMLDEDSKRDDRRQLPLAPAQARLAAREMIETDGQSTNADSSLVERARSLAVAAGWRDSSDAHLRQIVEALDQDACAMPGEGGISR